ncbi:hypothetical protein M9H77_31321 [Catharanthus roseus]|uniref:Uncharacterized protein n=1 Tax=Catharanthus roseus TaxID=4058 RepID=A0ACC0A1U2_CATRO|nr:hypothetical protein M9H77_31321 [Catharanthus roseus]
MKVIGKYFEIYLESTIARKKIKVRVTRMWDAMNTVTGKLISLEMVLLDEHVTVVRSINTVITGIKVHKFEFVKFKDITSRFQDDIYTTDVIGKLCKMSSICEIFIDGRKATIREIELKDMRQML